ncbi:hypothetical protein ACFP9V_01175 [Deinococcus radiopugnans]|uniref:hypothetical protein n=1 Tax=Deinococcus radiopugnans TaxID=57497 RepID=UPI0036062C7E
MVTELADVIARNTGCGFRDAHAHVKALLDHLHHQGRAVSTLMAADLAAVGLHLPEAEVQSALNPAEFIARRTTFGGPAPSVMAGEIAAARTRLDTDFTHHASLSTRFADARTHLVGGSI